MFNTYHHFAQFVQQSKTHFF